MSPDDAGLPLEFNRFAIRLAVYAPQLVPAFIWLLLVSSHGLPALRRMKQDVPPPEEVKALVLLGGDQIRDLLGRTGAGRRSALEIDALAEDLGLMEVRWRAAQRFGFGIESLIWRGSR